MGLVTHKKCPRDIRSAFFSTWALGPVQRRCAWPAFDTAAWSWSNPASEQIYYQSVFYSTEDLQKLHSKKIIILLFYLFF